MNNNFIAKYGMEPQTLKNMNKITFYLDTSGAQISTLCVDVVHSFNTSVN